MRHQIRRNLLAGIAAAAALTLVWAVAGWIIGGWAGVAVWSLHGASDPGGFRSAGELAGVFVGAAVGVALILIGRFRRPGASPAAIGIDPALRQRLDDAASALAMGAGMRAPEICVVKGGSAADVVGRNSSDALITVGADVVKPLQRDELMALLAHEVSHIKNGDTIFQGIQETLHVWTQRLLAIGVITYIAGFAALPFFGRDLRSGYTIGVVLTSAWVLLICAVVARGAGWLAAAWLLTTRELIADATAVNLTRDPQALLRALRVTAQIAAGPKRSPCLSAWPGRLEAINRIAAVSET